MLRDPGASHEYSNLGFGLLGYALAQLDHRTYGALTGETILKPLGMTMSGTAFTDAMRVHLAPGHDATGEKVKNWDFDALAGAGAIRSSTNDMLRYLKANIDRRVAVGRRYETRAVTTQRDGENGTHRAGLDDDRQRNRLAQRHDRWLRKLSSVSPANGRRGVVILTNTAASADDLGFATLDANAPLAPAYSSDRLAPVRLLGDYVGTYKLADEFLLQVFRINDELFVRATGQNAIPHFPICDSTSSSPRLWESA